MAGDQGKAESASRKAGAVTAAPNAVTGTATLVTSEAEAAIASQSATAPHLHALDQRLREILVVLPPALAAADEASDLGAALKALSNLLT